MKKILEQRLGKLQMAVDKEKLGGLILNQSPYTYHLTDWLPPSWAAVFAVLGPRGMVLVAPFQPEEIESSGGYVLVYADDPVQVLEQALHQVANTERPIGAALDALPAAVALPLSQNLTLHDAASLVFDVTAEKDGAAQQAIRERVGYLDRAFETAQKAIRPGVSETEVFGTIYSSLAQSLGSPVAIDCNFGSGKRALGNEPQPTNKLIEAGEVVMIDLFPRLGGYVADYTRNFAVGEPSVGQLAQHAVLEKALAAAETHLRPGITAGEIDRLVRKVIEDEGYGEFAYKHHTGHAFGLTIPEPPWLVPDEPTPLRKGMVIAVEPGIYHPINGGMRLEGNYIITEDGIEPLVKFPARLIPCL